MVAGLANDMWGGGGADSSSSSSENTSDESDSSSSYSSSSSEDEKPAFMSNYMMGACFLGEIEDERAEELAEAKEGGPFNLDAQTDSWCIDNTRFDKDGLQRMHESLQMPAEITLDNSSRVDSLEALVLTLCRLSYPKRLRDLRPTFPHSDSQLSRIFNSTISWLDEKCIPYLEELDKDPFNPEEIASAIGELCPLKNCIGFLDGTVRGICRPKYNQEEVYNGHKRKHALKYQGLVLGNGLLKLYAVWPGRRHDAFMLGDSSLPNQLLQLPRNRAGERFCVYGDPAYAHTETVQVPYKNRPLTPEQKAFNDRMAQVRETIEQGFGKVLQYFGYVDFAKGQKLFLQPVGKYYRVAVFLTNCHSCLYGSAFASRLHVQTPELESYLS